VAIWRRWRPWVATLGGVVIVWSVAALFVANIVWGINKPMTMPTERFLQSGYQVRALTHKSEWDDCPTEQMQVDTLNPKSLSSGFEGCEAVIHLAALPSPMSGSDMEVFESNAVGTFNVLQASGELGIKHVSIASSDCAWGCTFNKKPLVPEYFPLDEMHPVHPDNSYGLGKKALEAIADGFAQRYDMSIATMRITHVVRPFEYEEGSRFMEWMSNPDLGPRNFWAYIDVRDAAQAFRLGIEVNLCGHEVFSINSDVNRCMMPVSELISRHYPGTELRSEFTNHESLLCNSKAKRLLGFVPHFRWDINLGE
jgi:nucleoside-diphosphate-sugar epimerase